MGVTGTWVSLAQATPVATVPSPFAVLSPSPLASPRTSPVASPGTPVPASPQPDNRVTAVLAQSVGPDGRPVNPTTTFAPSTDKIYLAFETHGLPANTHLEAIWIADQVEAPVPAGYEVTRSTIEVQGNQVGNFALSKPNPGFPNGQYHVDLYLDGARIGSYPFTVK